MSGFAGSCPSCGGQVVFHLGHSLLKVCDHCGSALARKGANLESYGKVASLIPTTSILKLGVHGDYAGAPRSSSSATSSSTGAKAPGTNG